jgi:3-deoxy-D-manno-octulosonic-acid transferase
MYFIYSLMLGVGLLILLPKFLLVAFRHGKYISGLSERLGFLQPVADQSDPVIWLHCVSVGEVQAARPLFQALRQEFPGCRLVISTVTVTGQQLASDIFKGQAHKIFYFPIDWGWTVRRSLQAIHPSVVLIMETELWPGFLHQCRKRNVPVAIVNGRLSEKSFRRYRIVRRFFTRILHCLVLAVMQTDADADRMRALGLPADRVMVSGNMKFDAGRGDDDTQNITDELTKRFALNDATVLLAASTHDPEEQIILEAFANLRAVSASGQVRLIIAPRHPERFGVVAARLDASSFSWSRRSAQPASADSQADIILLDSIGELRSVFSLASVVFVGGSIAPVGGHNILEPAAAGACIVTGPHTQNFAEIVRTFTAESAIIQMAGEDERELTEIFERLLPDPRLRQELGSRAQALMQKHRGATSRTIEILRPIIMDATNKSRSLQSHRKRS